MSLPLLLYSVTLASAVLACLSLAAVAVSRWRVQGARPFAALVSAAALYAFGSLFEIHSASVDSVHFWLSFEYLGIVVLGPLWLAFARSLAGKGRGGRIWFALSLVLPLAFLALVMTNDVHHLFYSSIHIRKQGPFTVPLLGKGPFYFAQIAYMNAFLLAGTFTVLFFLLRARGAYKKQAAIVLAGALVPWAGMALYLGGLSPYGLDTAPLGLTMSGILSAIGLFRYRLLDLAPVVHEKVFEGMRDAVLVLDLKGRVLALNPALASVFPAILPERVGDPVAPLLGDRPELLALLGGEAGRSVEVEVELGEGVACFEAASGALLDRRQRRLGTILTFRDISARVELLEKLRKMAVTDVLTGIPNRRSILDTAHREVERARRNGKPFALAIMDLDHFKAVNDCHGHQAGDEVLAATAATCVSRLRTTDFFGRYGGEEFIVILPDTPLREAVAIVERLRSGVETLPVDLPDFCVDGAGSVRVRASIGLSCAESIGALDLPALLREADEALYEAKAGGRNRVVARLVGRGASPAAQAQEATP